MNRLLQRAFADAHRRSVVEFSDDTILLWFPTARGGYEFTVGIQAMKGTVQMREEGLAGMMTLPVDGLTVNALKADFPFVPQEKDLFLKGPALSGNPALPDPARCVRFMILTISDVEINAHYHLTCQAHA